MGNRASEERRRNPSQQPPRRNPPILGSGLLRVLALCVCGVLAAAQPCGCEASTRKKPLEADDVLFRVGSDVVRVDDVQSQIDHMSPAVRSRYASPQEQRTFFDKTLKNEILAAEAERLGYARDPEVVMAMKKAMVLKLLKERIGTESAPGEITEAAIEQYYREHADAFIHPEEVRITQIVVKSMPRAVEVLDEASKAAAAARSQTTEDPAAADMKAFRNLVFKYSQDEESVAHGGDLTPIVGREEEHPIALRDAAFALRNAGDLSPIVQTTKGFHILKLRQRVPGSTRTLQESRARIVRLLSDQVRDRKTDELVAALAKNMPVEVFEERFVKVRFEVEETAQTAPPGLVPDVPQTPSAMDDSTR